MASAVTVFSWRRERRGRPVELIGPPGAGKSALAAVLSRRNASFRRALTAWDLTPWLLATHGVDQLRSLALWGRPPELLHIRCYYDLARIAALCTRLHYADLRCYDVVLLDEGPVFLLTNLLAIRAQALRSSVLQERWLEALRRCAATIDQLVWIDAPDAVLAQRIRDRAKPHRIKAATDSEIADFCARFRTAFAEVSRLFAGHGGPRVVRVNAREPLERMALHVSDALEASHVD